MVAILSLFFRLLGYILTHCSTLVPCGGNLIIVFQTVRLYLNTLFYISSMWWQCLVVFQAVEVLYSVGFPYVGQIHSGNVFMFDKDRFVLGGYENTLLGYRTSCFQDLKATQLLDKIDVIMFGEFLQGQCSRPSHTYLAHSYLTAQFV